MTNNGLLFVVRQDGGGGGESNLSVSEGASPNALWEVWSGIVGPFPRPM